MLSSLVLCSVAKSVMDDDEGYMYRCTVHYNVIHVEYSMCAHLHAL